VKLTTILPRPTDGHGPVSTTDDDDDDDECVRRRRR
jgi:hypothetical protein